MSENFELRAEAYQMYSAIHDVVYSDDSTCSDLERVHAMTFTLGLYLRDLIQEDHENGISLMWMMLKHIRVLATRKDNRLDKASPS